MRTSKATSHMLAACVAIAMFAGCSGGSSPVAPNLVSTGGGTGNTRGQEMQNARLNNILALQGGMVSDRRVTTPSFFNPDAQGKARIFVSDFIDNVVDIYPERGKNQTFIGQITGLSFPLGLAADAASNLYIANGGNGSTGGDVLVYGPPYTNTPKLTLADGAYQPNGVAVSPAGLVAVANYCTQPSCGSGTGSVNFYRKNATKPCANLPAFYLEADAFDAAGNLYVVGINNNPNVGEVIGGCKAKKIKPLTTSNTIGFAGAIEIDKAGRIAILNDSAQGGVIYTYDPPKNGSLGTPVSTTPLTLTCPSTFAFLASGKDLYAADQCGWSYKFDYPVGGAAENSLTKPPSGSPRASGVAVTPPLVP